MYRRILAGASLLALVAAPMVATAAPAPTGSTADYAIVTFKDAPLATYQGGTNGIPATKPQNGRLDASSPAYRAYERFLANEHASYKSHLAQKFPAVEVLDDYDTVLNGVAVKLNGASLTALAKHPKVASAEASWTYQPTMNASNEIIGSPALWQQLGGQEGAGAGIDVGIIDSGIQDEHPFFDCKGDIQHKTYASGVAGSGEDIVNSHGTHVAGTVAGCVTELPGEGMESPIEGTISGVAPGAALYDYNVFPGYGGGYVAFGGSAFSHDIAAAVEDAVDDGMDVINLSLGGSVQGQHDYLAEAINGAVAAGVVAAVSAGNEGPGAYTIGSPGNAVGALTVGATTNSHKIVTLVQTPFGDFEAAVGEFDPFAEHPVTDAPFVQWNAADPTACTGSAPAASVDDSVVLIKRGGCTFAEKVATAAAAGAEGVVVYNNADGDPISMGGTGNIPAVMVSKADGETIAANLPSTVTINGNAPVELFTEPDILADFSSRGPGPFLTNIKPDVVAPGVNIYSSVFDETTGDLGWAMFQGTSMAAPHVAGSAALLLALDPTLSPADVKSKLGNNAERTVWADARMSKPAGVLERGGGRIDLERAAAATTTFDPMSLSFGVHKGNKPVSRTITVTVTNHADAHKMLTLSEGDPALTLSTDELHLPPGESGTFSVTLNARGVASGGGDITVTDGTTTQLLPFYYSTGN
ncbi:S8 family serine peptidase [Ornithinimicrobium tianjinense]|uniref:Minor extracellular protease vpr n=1 Tax=Ornithinimicrobium tianjinense TaxID=1195761 RepID=A0A917BTN5_9MICO|nr:S8 family serine peptidase [Ornithinimicrobium tianjinense]GGF58340.1 minor extracellular protease vpr [Ornithinimicrobium tianjinense]